MGIVDMCACKNPVLCGGNKGISVRNVDVRERFSRNLQIRADRSRLLYTLMGMDFEELREF